MTVEDEVWLALNILRASHRDGGCQRAECAIASLYDEDLEEILHAIPHDNSARVKELEAKLATVVDCGQSSPEGDASEGEERRPRFNVGDRVVYDPEAQINTELDDYTALGVCTVTALDVEGYGQLLSFVDERGDMHDGWWADRFMAAPVQATTEDGEGDVTYFVAFRSATGYGYRVLLPRPRIVTAADVIALTDLLAADVGGDVVPLNWIELPPPLPKTAQARQVAFNKGGSSTEIRSTLSAIRVDRGDDPRVLSVSVPSAGGTPQTHPDRAAAGERADLPYLPRRAM
jgi:hypothetical protein